ncbi:hypothetical protein [Sphingobacterium siyangense]|uniref:hypothetical protein n=1 Tax=Sphingobacterium siyangense TaxID=459529 RepID=UPI0015FF1AFB|nr:MULTISPECIES: hypothetical protein [Sphingobacterium]QQT31396.1 hypothetical protein I6I99_02155 [Sphingobacterium multivorum]QRY57783.1 hypothetical protein JVX97_28050 [Sphingobacterium siyangense]
MAFFVVLIVPELLLDFSRQHGRFLFVMAFVVVQDFLRLADEIDLLVPYFNFTI